MGNDNSNERKDTVKLKNEGQQQTNIRSQQKNKCC